MAKNFKELRAQMAPKAQAYAAVKAGQMIRASKSMIQGSKSFHATAVAKMIRKGK